MEKMSLMERIKPKLIEMGINSVIVPTPSGVIYSGNIYSLEMDKLQKYFADKGDEKTSKVINDLINWGEVLRLSEEAEKVNHQLFVNVSLPSFNKMHLSEKKVNHKLSSVLSMELKEALYRTAYREKTKEYALRTMFKDANDGDFLIQMRQVMTEKMDYKKQTLTLILMDEFKKIRKKIISDVKLKRTE